MKRSILLLLLLLLLGLGTWYTLKTKTKEHMPVSNAMYAIDDISRVQTAGLIYADGRKFIFKRTPKGWSYNGQKANKNVVNTMLNTVRQLRILYATPTSAKETILQRLATDKIKVELYGKDNEPLQIFYVGATSTDGNSTYFIKEDSNEPHLVGVPNFHGNIRHNFYRPESDWISKIIFDQRPEEIAELSIEYPMFKNRSFRLQQKNETLEAVPFYDINPASSKAPKLGAISTFLSFFDKIGAEAIEPNMALQDSLNQLTPYATLTLKQIDGAITVNRFFPYIPTGFTLDNLPGQHRDNSHLGVNRYFVINEADKCFLAQHRVIGKVLWSYQDFFNQ